MSAEQKERIERELKTAEVRVILTELGRILSILHDAAAVVVHLDEAGEIRASTLVGREALFNLRDALRVVDRPG